MKPAEPVTRMRRLGRFSALIEIFPLAQNDRYKIEGLARLAVLKQKKLYQPNSKQSVILAAIKHIYMDVLVQT